MAVASLVQTALWRRLDGPGHDACGLWLVASGWRLAGTAMFVANELPCNLAYNVQVDLAWKTRAASVSGWIGKDEVKVVTTLLGEQGWCGTAGELPALRGLVDLDLGFTPATNLLQLQRLSLAVGEQAEAPVAYLDFPSMALERLEQRYHRQSPTTYAYQAPRFEYEGILAVSESGWITHYPGLWALVSAAP
jgi:hypothetical protein